MADINVSATIADFMDSVSDAAARSAIGAETAGAAAAAQSAAIAASQPVNAKLTAIAALTNGAGALTNNGSGVFSYIPGAGSGTVTSASVATANGFSGSVGTPTTTPVITVSTTVTGLLKGNGVSVSAATAGTDYVVPSGSITGNAATVTTNANLTGIVTSTGNSTTIADGAIALSKLATDPRKVVVKVASGNYTVGTTSADELKGGIIYVTAAATITIPAVTAGASFTVITIGAVAVSVDPNAADLIYLDGLALSDGDKITNLSTAGDTAVLTYYDATGWHASTNGWTDGN